MIDADPAADPEPQLDKDPVVGSSESEARESSPISAIEPAPRLTRQCVAKGLKVAKEDAPVKASKATSSNKRRQAKISSSIESDTPLSKQLRSSGSSAQEPTSTAVPETDKVFESEATLVSTSPVRTKKPRRWHMHSQGELPCKLIAFLA